MTLPQLQDYQAGDPAAGHEENEESVHVVAVQAHPLSHVLSELTQCFEDLVDNGTDVLALTKEFMGRPEMVEKAQTYYAGSATSTHIEEGLKSAIRLTQSTIMKLQDYNAKMNAAIEDFGRKNATPQQLNTISRAYQLQTRAVKRNHMIAMADVEQNLLSATATSTTSPAGSEAKRRRGNLPLVSRRALKAWLQAHLDNPYPTEQEKVQLMAETSMTLTQVNNWFINARRRLVPKLKDDEKAAQDDEDKEKSYLQQKKSFWTRLAKKT